MEPAMDSCQVPHPNYKSGGAGKARGRDGFGDAPMVPRVVRPTTLRAGKKDANLLGGEAARAARGSNRAFPGHEAGSGDILDKTLGNVPQTL